MPTKITCVANEDNTLIVTLNFTDSDGDDVIPNAGLTYTWSEPDGTIVNTKSNVDLIEAAQIVVELTGDDLANLGANDSGVRYFSVDGDYDNPPLAAMSLDKVIFVVIDSQRPVGLYEMKEHLNIEQTNTDDDLYISGLIQAARERIEDLLERKLITQDITEYFAEWPDNGFFDISYGNLISVDSVNYVDTDNSSTEWAKSNYFVETNTTKEQPKGRVVLGYGKAFPSDTLQVSLPINVVYSCGFGAEKAHVPAPIIHAIKIAVSDWYEQRESTGLTTMSIYDFKTIDILIKPYKLGGV